MLFKMASNISNRSNLRKPHKAKVVDNKDPQKLGRVKVEIEGILKGNIEDLPWVYPNNQTAHGGNNKSASFSVPRLGSELRVVFPTGSVYEPFYDGYWHNEKNYAMDPFKENYPQRYGSVDPSGNQTIYDNKTGDYYYNYFGKPDNQEEDSNQQSMTRSSEDDKPKLNVHIDKGGNITLNVQGNVNVSAKGKVMVKSSSQIIAKAPKISLN